MSRAARGVGHVGAAARSATTRLADARPLHIAALLFAAAVAFRFFDTLARILLIAYAAAILAVVLNVIVRRLPLARRWVTVLVGSTILALLATAIFFGGRLLLGQLRDLVTDLPAIQAQVTEWLTRAGQATGLNLRGTAAAVGEQAASATSGRSILGGARGVLGAIGLALIVLFGGLFALARPNEGLLNPLLAVVPESAQPRVRRMLQLLGERLVGWVQGQLLAMLAVGVLATIAFYLIGVPYALLLGILNGLLEFIPLIGPWLGGVPAVVVAAVDDPMKGLWTAIAVTAIQQIENAFITPLAMSNRAHVHPFITLFALFLFGSLFGLLGILLAVPLVLLIWTAVQVFWVERGRGTPPDAVEPVVSA